MNINEQRSVELEQDLNNQKKAENTTSSSHNAKPNVGCCASFSKNKGKEIFSFTFLNKKDPNNKQCLTNEMNNKVKNDLMDILYDLYHEKGVELEIIYKHIGYLE